MKPRCESGVRARVDDDVRGRMETMSWCPVERCVGGQMEDRCEDDQGRYSITWVTCHLYEGTGVVPKFVAAQYLKKVGS